MGGEWDVVLLGDFGGPLIHSDGDGVGGVWGESEGDSGVFEFLLDGLEVGVEVGLECGGDCGGGGPDAEELEVGGSEHWGFGKGSDGDVFEHGVWCAGDVPHCDGAACEGFGDAEVDGVCDVGVVHESVGADHVEPGDETFVWVVGIGTDVGEVEVGVGVDEGGDDDLVWKVDGLGGLWEGDGVDVSRMTDGVDLPGVVVGYLVGFEDE